MKEKKHSNSTEHLYKIFIYVVLILLAVIIIVPVAWVFMASIKQNKEFYGNPWTLPEGFYFQNFIDAWNTAKMGDYMLNSVFVTALALVILLIVALSAAYCLSRFKFKGSKFLNAAFMGGLFINVNYIVVPIFLMLRDGDNWLKSVIGKSFLLNNLVILAIVYAATALPFTIYLLSGYFSTLAHDYEEAAYIDGAGYSTTMWKIIFPMAKPSIITVILFNFLSFWNDCWWFKGLMRREIKMEFGKKHTKCRIILMAALFIAGISLSVFRWGMTGKITGLGIMLIGIICLLMALWIYNCPFAEKKKRM